MFLFWAPNGLNELTEMRFKFPFNLIGKSTMALLTGQSKRVIKSWYTGAQNKDFYAVLQTDLGPSVAQAISIGRGQILDVLEITSLFYP